MFYLLICVLIIVPLSANEKLIGGRPALSTEFLSTVRIRNNCTAAKVGENKLLLAAHCLVNEKNKIRLNMSIGKSIFIKNHYLKKWQEYKISKHFIHNSFRREVRRHIRRRDERQNFAEKSFDIALIEVDRALEGIPTAPIDFSKVKPGDKLIIGGFGCEKNIFTPTPARLKRLKMGLTVAIYKNKIYKYVIDASSTLKYNIITAARNLSTTYPGLCPGDSGGPVYRFGNDKSIVGVNSYYVFKNNTGVPYANLHTRLSALKIWLNGIL
ncbi:MAG: S1 family peptidase [Bacteriovoracaceae bacterium]|nr:S1 family peptidase [Bacteriovoracaceae bacterium]